MGIFTQKAGQSFSVAASTSNANTQLNPTQIGASVYRVYNAGQVPVHVRWGNGAQTAATTSMALAPGAVELFGKLPEWDNVAVITSSGTATVYFTPGEGE